MDVNEHERLTNITLRYKIRVKEQLVEWNDMDVNKHERLSSIILRYKIKVKERHFYCCSTFHSHSSVFINGHNSFTNMSVKCL
jgi:hypothetical protein